MSKADSYDSFDPYPHDHLWLSCEEKDRRSGKITKTEKCKFCKITREVKNDNR